MRVAWARGLMTWIVSVPVHYAQWLFRMLDLLGFCLLAIWPWISLGDNQGRFIDVCWGPSFCEQGALAPPCANLACQVLNKLLSFLVDH